MTDSVTLTPGRYDKLGVLHVGVGRDGFVAVAGDVYTLADGETHRFERTGVSVTRQGDEYTFTRAARQAA